MMVLFVTLKGMKMASAEDLVQMFMKIGLSEQKSKETLKNTGVTNYLKICIDAVSISLPACLGC